MTSYDFVSLFISSGILFSDDAFKDKVQSDKRKVASKNLTKLVRLITRISLLVPELRYFKPSMVASASLFISRKLFGMKKPWSVELQIYTTYSAENLK